MSTENPLATIDATNNAVACANDDVFDAIQSGSAFLPRLQLMTANAEKCKEGAFPTNHYARVSGTDFQDLGLEVDVLVCAWRPAAIGTDEEGGIIISYDPMLDDDKKATGIFAKIMAQADDKENQATNMYGPQYLVWVPATKEFMTFLMGTATARNASQGVKAQLLKPATLGSEKIEGKKHTWFGPTGKACSTPFEMPTAEEAEKQIQLFNNPPEPKVEAVEGDDAGNSDRE